MTKILVPTDFSPTAGKALDYAVQIAKLNKGTILLVHACSLVDSSFRDKNELKTEFNNSITDEAHDKLSLLKKSIEETEKIPVNIQLYSGTVHDTVLDAADEFKASLIVMGTMGITGLKEKIFGSKTAYIIGKSKIPVITIPIEYDWSEPKKILLTINHIEEANDLVHPVFHLARLFHTQVQIAIFSNEEDIVNKEHYKHMEKILTIRNLLRDKYPDITIEAHHLGGQRFHETLNEYIDNNKIDMLAMLTHKRSFTSSIFNRSLTKKMSYHAKIPLVAIPVPEK
ncbi:MAG: universal stress protein [Chitinophagaceae bacterium]